MTDAKGMRKASIVPRSHESRHDQSKVSVSGIYVTVVDLGDGDLERVVGGGMNGVLSVPVYEAKKKEGDVPDGLVAA